MRQPKRWVSLLIVLVVGLHALPVLSYQGVAQTRWPFLVWAMYARSFPPGPVQTTVRRLVGTTASGRTEEVTPKLVGLSKSTYRNLYINPLYQGDTATALALLERVNRQLSDPLVEIRTEGLIYRLADQGLVTEPFPVIAYRVPPAEPAR